MARVFFHEDRCKGCGICIKFCPRKIIVEADYFNHLGFHPATVTEMQKCTGCAVCAWMCPDVVIEVERSEKDNAKDVNER